ncbi:MAG: hypothetical protein Q7K55_01295 [Candidatus Levybacteria bacterium]|nr:hypothetical protein [Candidatus Levybacteria bacterium]
MREIDTTYESWSKRRIIIGLLAIVILFGIGFGVKEIAVKQIASFKDLYKTKVAGVSTKKEQESLNEKSKEQPSVQSFKWKEDMQERLDLLKKEVGGLNVSDIASSSPQIKKLIEDLQGLQQLPRNQAKEACYNICRGL